MHTTVLSQNRPAWTWADLFSTYRFWGLFLWFVLASAAMQIHYLFLYQHLNRLLWTFSMIGTVTATTRGLSLSIALILAWAAIRSKPVVILLCTSGVAALAAFALAAGWPGGLVATEVLLFCMQLGAWVVTLLFPTLIAGALGGYETFVVAFGVALLSQHAMSLVMMGVSSALIRSYGLATAGYVSAGMLLAAVICLIPVKHALFTVEPPARGRAIAPSHREPFLAGLLALIVPFYLLYWLYKAHGEAAYLKPSRALLSPRGAAWIAGVVVLFPLTVTPLVMRLMAALPSLHVSDVAGLLAVPFMALAVYAILLTNLANHLNVCAAESGLPRVCAPWAVFLLTMLFSPVALGILQAGLNKLAERTAQPALVPGA